MGLAQKLFGTQSSKEIKRIMPLVHKIEGLRSQMMELSDEELRGKTMEFKKRLADGETLDDLLPEAYAVVREAARRVLEDGTLSRCRSSAALSCIRDVSPRCVPVKVRLWYPRFRHT